VRSFNRNLLISEFENILINCQFYGLIINMFSSKDEFNITKSSPSS
jgi:hypothetical protein